MITLCSNYLDVNKHKRRLCLRRGARLCAPTVQFAINGIFDNKINVVDLFTIKDGA
jgi:hypothetical protein